MWAWSASTVSDDLSEGSPSPPAASLRVSIVGVRRGEKERLSVTGYNELLCHDSSSKVLAKMLLGIACELCVAMVTHRPAVRNIRKSKMT